MAAQRIGYIRASVDEKNIHKLLDGVDLDKLIIDYLPLASKNQPKLQECIDSIGEGDTLVVYSMDRLSHRIDELKEVISKLTKIGVRLEFLKEGFVFDGNSSFDALDPFVFMEALLQFTRTIMEEYQFGKIRKKKLYRGRKPSLTKEQAKRIKELNTMGVPKTKIAKEFGVTRQTVYEYLKE